jgi:hypothetical protein
MLDAMKLWLVLLALLGTTAWAQTVSLGLLAGDAALKPAATIENLALGNVRLELRAAGTVSGPLELGLGLRTTLSLGPVGNVVLSGRGDLATDGLFSTRLSGAAVIGAVAVRGRIAAFNTNPGRFDLREAFEDVRPRLPEPWAGGVGLSLGAGLTYRLERNIILELDPDLSYLTGQGFGGRLSAALQLRRLVGQDDGRVLLLADLAPGAVRGYVATGFEYRWRRGLPTASASLWLGYGSLGLWPGVRLNLSGPVEEGWRGGLELALEPYRTDALPYRATALLQGPAGPGELSLHLLVAPASDLPPISLLLSYSFRF